MPRRHARFATGLILAALLTSAAAGAEEAGRFYVGVGLGRVDYSGDYRGIDYGDTLGATRLYAGFQLRDRAAVELALTSADGPTTGEILGSGIERLDIASDYGAVGVRGMFRVALRDLVPQWQRITVFGTAGAFAADEKRRVAELVANRTQNDVVDDGGITYGAGVVYGLSRFSVRAAVERLDGRKENHTAFEVAAEFRF